MCIQKKKRGKKSSPQGLSSWECQLVLSVNPNFRSYEAGKMSVKPNRKVDIWWFKTCCVSISWGKARQTCLVALRYDDAAAGTSSDNVTHSNAPTWKRTCGGKDVHKNTQSLSAPSKAAACVLTMCTSMRMFQPCCNRLNWTGSVSGNVAWLEHKTETLYWPASPQKETWDVVTHTHLQEPFCFCSFNGFQTFTADNIILIVVLMKIKYAKLTNANCYIWNTP